LPARLSEKEARAICEKLLRATRADDALVNVSREEASYLRFAANTITECASREDRSVLVTVWIDRRRGSATTNETDASSLRALVEQAEQIARHAPEDPEYLPTLGPQTYRPARGYVEATASLSPAARARAIGDILAACEKENVIGAGFHQASEYAGARAARNGSFFYRRSTRVGLSVTARTGDGGGSGYFLRSHFDIARLDTARIAREAIGKALRSRDPRPLEPGAYTVILEPQAVADLLTFFSFSFDARSADEGRSPFSAPAGKTRVGEKIFDERVNLYSDPWHPDLPGDPAAPGGIPAQKLYLIRNGKLETLIYSRFWAKAKQKEPTPGPVNTILESSTAAVSVEEMIRTTERGLLVSRFWYVREVDPRSMLWTGLTRDGLWYIESGKIQYPVRNLRFNQSILEMLAPGNLELIGAPERVGSSEGQGFSAALLPPLKVKRFHFTSPSDAV
jgi:predicted Zn-dependent protease